MNYTVSDFYRTFDQGVRLVAGSEGLSREISSAGILDYELEPALRDKYFHTNFHEGQFALTTFLYARENPFFIGDAVKHLVLKGASGLAVKNVFHLHLPDSVLRYADAKNFPLFIIDSPHVYFEDVIFQINDRIRWMRDLRRIRAELDTILRGGLQEQEQLSHIYRLNPSLENQHIAVFIAFDDFFEDFQFAQYEMRYRQSNLCRISSMFLPYRNGILFVSSWDGEADVSVQELLRQLHGEIFDDATNYTVGISRAHRYLGDLPRAVEESVHASVFAQESGKKQENYAQLGALQILIPFCNSREMLGFSQNIMEKLEEYDAEFTGHLVETLETFCRCGQNIAAAARELDQHENTIRYRLEKIHGITGLHYRKSSEMEQLSLAYLIKLCRRLLSQ